jgi:hypothetical protein
VCAVALLPILIIIIAGLFLLERLSIKHAFDGIGYDIKPSGSLLEQEHECFATFTTNE